MTTDEKLQSFYESATAEAAKQAEAMLAEHRTALEAMFEEHKTDIMRRAQLQIQIATDKLKKNANKELSRAELDIKRELGEEQERLKDSLFSEVLDRLTVYMNSREYQQLLEDQIKSSLEFAKSDSIIIYIDPADAPKKQELEAATGASLTVSEYSFNGGIRAVIPGRKVLIDNSFQTKLEKARREFTFRFGKEETSCLKQD